MLIAIDHGNKQVKPSMETPLFPVYKKQNQTLRQGYTEIRRQLLYAVSAAYPYQKDKPQTSGSLSCRYLPLRRKSKHRTLILPG